MKQARVLLAVKAALVGAWLALAALLPNSALATSQFPDGNGNSIGAVMIGCYNGTTWVPATTGGTCLGGGGGGSSGAFTPGGFTAGYFASLTATNAASASTALPTNTGTVEFRNANSVDVSCTLSTGTATGLTNELILPANSVRDIGVGSFTAVSCINQTGTASNQILMIGGSGGTSFGGGGSGGGSGGAITAASGAYAAGAFAAGAGVDGWDLTQGTKTDAACAGDNTSGCSVESRLQRIAQNLTTLNSTAGNPLAAGSAIIGKVGIDQTTPGTTNGVQLPASQVGVGATGSAPPANAGYLGANGSGATGGLLTGVKTCDQTAIYDASTTGSTLLKAGVSGRKFYICGFFISTGGTATNVKLVEGTTTTTPCDTGTASVTPAFQLAANDKVGGNSAFWNGLATATAADNLCINASAANAVQAIVWFAIE